MVCRASLGRLERTTKSRGTRTASRVSCRGSRPHLWERSPTNPAERMVPPARQRVGGCYPVYDVAMSQGALYCAQPEGSDFLSRLVGTKNAPSPEPSLTMCPGPGAGRSATNFTL